jgi:adenosylcobinamide amidohydrolase
MINPATDPREVARSVVIGNGAVEIRFLPRWLVVRFGAEHEVLSAAPVGGGCRRTRTVAWHEVRDDELCPPVNPERLLARRLSARGLSGAVALLTSRDLTRHVTAERRHGGVSAQVVATVGLSNALRAGDPPGLGERAGTINILCRVSETLSEVAAIETLSMVAEARTLAVLEASVKSSRSGLPSTGTGTDCIVVAWPIGRRKALYAGKHTELGHVVGSTVSDAVRKGVLAWQEEQSPLGSPTSDSPRSPGAQRTSDDDRPCMDGTRTGTST